MLFLPDLGASSGDGAQGGGGSIACGRFSFVHGLKARRWRGIIYPYHHLGLSENVGLIFPMK